MSNLSNSFLDDRDVGLYLCKARIFRQYIHSAFVIGNGFLEESKAAMSN